MIIKRNLLIKNIGCILVTIITVSGSLFDFIPITLQFFIVLMAYMFCLVYGRLKFGRNIKSYKSLIIFMIFFMVWRNPYFKIGLGSQILMLRLCYPLFFCYTMCYDESWIETLMNMLYISYIFYGICTIFFYLVPQFYFNYVVRLFPTHEYDLIHQMLTGCSPGLTLHYSVNGIFMGILVIFSCGRLFAKSKKNVFDYILVVFSIVAVLLTGKRGHIIFSALGILITYYNYMCDKPCKRFKNIIFGGIVGTSLLLFAYVFAPKLVNFIYRFQETSQSGDVSLGRFDMWKIAIDLYKQHPIFGIGWDCYKVNNTIIANVDSHNSYVQLLCETGTIGTIIFLTWIIGMLIFSIKVYRKLCYKKHDICSNDIRYLSISLSMQVFFIAYGMTGNPLTTKESYLPYYITCCIALIYGYKYQNSNMRNNKND